MCELVAHASRELHKARVLSLSNQNPLRLTAYVHSDRLKAWSLTPPSTIGCSVLLAKTSRPCAATTADLWLLPGPKIGSFVAPLSRRVAVPQSPEMTDCRRTFLQLRF